MDTISYYIFRIRFLAEVTEAFFLTQNKLE